MKSSLGGLIQVTVWVITEIRITKDTQEMLALLIYANVAFLQLNVNNLAWATTGDTITMQPQVQKFTLFSQLIRPSLRETERERQRHRGRDREKESQKRKEGKKKEVCRLGFRYQHRKYQFCLGFILFLKSLLWCKSCQNKVAIKKFYACIAFIMAGFNSNGTWVSQC